MDNLKNNPNYDLMMKEILENLITGFARDLGRGQIYQKIEEIEKIEKIQELQQLQASLDFFDIQYSFAIETNSLIKELSSIKEVTNIQQSSMAQQYLKFYKFIAIQQSAENQNFPILKNFIEFNFISVQSILVHGTTVAIKEIIEKYYPDKVTQAVVDRIHKFLEDIKNLISKIDSLSPFLQESLVSLKSTLVESKDRIDKLHTKSKDKITCFDDELESLYPYSIKEKYRDCTSKYESEMDKLFTKLKDIITKEKEEKKNLICKILSIIYSQFTLKKILKFILEIVKATIFVFFGKYLNC